MLKTLAVVAAAAALANSPPAVASDVAQMLTPTLVLDWAEKTYPTLFPGGVSWLNGYYQRVVPNDYLDPYVYRHYAKTGNYLGLLAEEIHLLGPASGNALLPVGRIEDFACSINRSSCAKADAEDGPLFLSDTSTAEILVARHRNPRAGTAIPAKSFVAPEGLGGKLFYDKAHDRLFAMTWVGAVAIDNASRQSSRALSVRRIVPDTAYSMTDMHYDRTRDTLYLLGYDRNGWRHITAFEGASLISGVVAPQRTVRLQGSWSTLAIDERRSIAYLKSEHAVALIPNIHSATGQLQVEQLPMGGDYVAVDSARDRVYTVGYPGRLYALSNASAATNATTIAAATLDLPNAQAMAFDEANDRLYVGTTNDFYVLNAASTIRIGTSWNAYGVKVLGAPNIRFTGFAFP